MGNDACRECEEVAGERRGEVEVGRVGGVKKIRGLEEAMDYKIERIGGGKVRIVYSSGEIYEGQVMGTMKHGRGRLQWPYGGYYDGQWLNDTATGRGVFRQNGDTYEGLFQKNHYINVKFTSADGSTIYEGTYNTSRNYHGRGTLIKKGQYVYVGDFEDGAKQGKGRIVFEKGGEYEGGFMGGRFEGQGVFVGEGYRYEGTWREGECHGRGRYEWESGAYYEGEYRYGEKDGEGVYVNAEGVTYRGHFMRGKRHGRGQEIDKGGVVTEVLFENGVRIEE